MRYDHFVLVGTFPELIERELGDSLWKCPAFFNGLFPHYPPEYDSGKSLPLISPFNLTDTSRLFNPPGTDSLNLSDFQPFLSKYRGL